MITNVIGLSQRFDQMLRIVILFRYYSEGVPTVLKLGPGTRSIALSRNTIGYVIASATAATVTDVDHDVGRG